MNRKMRRAAEKGAVRRPGAPPQPAADPGLVNAFLDKGWRALDAGQDAEAIDLAARVIRMAETVETKTFFATCVTRWSYFPGAETLVDIIARALREPWAAPADFAGVGRGLLDRDPVIGRAIARAMQAWPRRLPLGELLGADGIAAMSTHPLLLALLETSKIVGADLERFLTALRAGLLDEASREPKRIDEHVLRLCCALARQCIINEYVFDMTPEEGEQLVRLREKVDGALASRGRIAPAALAMLGAYAPIESIAAEVLRGRPLPQALNNLLEEVTREADAMRRHRKSTPRLTPIADATSRAVAEQYEQNPYPRWSRLPALGTPAAPDWIVPHLPPRTASAPDILIAGCGTGHHSILFAQGFPTAQILAVDLSLSSLAYAKEKSRAMGLERIAYAQADILELGAINKRFDVISSSGVLHHLADPANGWRVLLSLLRPNGIMHVGLYSALARRNIAKAREFVTARGYGASADGIRRARQELAAAAASEPAFADVLRYPDFYATSECRDLLFHAQECDFTIPQIQSFLDGNSLRFLGFLKPEALAAFRQRFPGRDTTDLNLWHQVETENPDTFKGMYEFWIRRR
jgi:SAM-dependent methyltransferase